MVISSIERIYQEFVRFSEYGESDKFGVGNMIVSIEITLHTGETVLFERITIQGLRYPMEVYNGDFDGDLSEHYIAVYMRFKPDNTAMLDSINEILNLEDCGDHPYLRLSSLHRDELKIFIYDQHLPDKPYISKLYLDW